MCQRLAGGFSFAFIAERPSKTKKKGGKCP